ncbi:MAG: DeoR/GlpR transcriptional regulator [Alkaliphilus sp.]|nr:DeoR/GlpR transcriptional regulator [Alkaliphilus sp.]
MFAEERRSRILEILEGKNRITVIELTESLKVSDSTIRRDLQDLEQAGLLKRTHGGAVKWEHTGFEATMAEKEESNIDEKRYIGEKAAALIEDNDTIILDAGTTTLEIAKHIKAKNITVLTNSILIALELSKHKDIEIVIIGGNARKQTLAIVGPFADMIIQNFRVDKAFIGSNSITLQDGCTTPNILEAHTKKTMIRSAKEVYIVADHSKFGKVSFASIAKLEDIDAIITDTNIDKQTVERFRQEGVEVLY